MGGALASARGSASTDRHLLGGMFSSTEPVGAGLGIAAVERGSESVMLSTRLLAGSEKWKCWPVEEVPSVSVEGFVIRSWLNLTAPQIARDPC